MLTPDSEEDSFGNRLVALETVFGKSDEEILHAVIPFEFGHEHGGGADVVQFRSIAPVRSM